MKIIEPSVALGREPWVEAHRGYSVIERRGSAPGLRQKTLEKVPEVLAGLRAGGKLKTVSADTRVYVHAVRKIRDAILLREKLPRCKCGRPADHAGYCRGGTGGISETKRVEISIELRSGQSCKRTAKLLGSDWRTVRKVRNMLAAAGIQLRCRCGKKHGHVGPCRGTQPKFGERWRRRLIDCHLERGRRETEALDLLRYRGNLSLRQMRNELGLSLDQAIALTRRMRSAGTIEKFGGSRRTARYRIKSLLKRSR